MSCSPCRRRSALSAAFGAIAFQNKAAVYNLLFRTAADTLITIAVGPKHLGARIGPPRCCTPGGSKLTHHPHVHVILPGGGLSPDGSFLDELAALHAADRLTFSATSPAGKFTFDAALAPLRGCECGRGAAAQLFSFIRKLTTDRENRP